MGRKKYVMQALDVILGILRGNAYATAEDAGLPDMARHDRRFHGGHYDPQTMTCSLRDRITKSDNPDADVAAHESSVGSITEKKIAEYLRLMAKKCPNLDPEDTLECIGNIPEKKLQADAFQWLMRGKVRLPEDMYKVREARTLAEKAKKDPLSYDTPQACINELQDKFKHGSQTSRDRIDPDTVPELSDKKVFPDGVTTYQVQDDAQGQAAMRRIIDSHWGKDANPWCLLARSDDEDRQDEDANERFLQWWDDLSADEKNRYGKTDIFTDDNQYDEDMSILGGGEAEAAGMVAERYFFDHVDTCYKSNEASMRNAWHYWNDVYNVLPKRVAFKDGKLLAFMATDGENYDRDALIEDLRNEYGDEYDEFNAEYGTPDDDSGQGILDYVNQTYNDAYQEALRDNSKEQWWDRNDQSHDGIPLGNLKIPGDPFGRWGHFEIIDGKTTRIGGFSKGMRHDNTYMEWYENGQVAKDRQDGIEKEFNEDGTLSDYQSTERKYYYRDGTNGDTSSIELSDGTDEFSAAFYTDGSILFKDSGRTHVSPNNAVEMDHWPTNRKYKIDSFGNAVEITPMRDEDGYINAEKLEKGFDLFGTTVHSYEDVAKVLWQEAMRRKKVALAEKQRAKELWARESHRTFTPETKANLANYLKGR